MEGILPRDFVRVRGWLARRVAERCTKQNTARGWKPETRWLPTSQSIADSSQLEAGRERIEIAGEPD
jgi:hypothetical protein